MSQIDALAYSGMINTVIPWSVDKYPTVKTSSTKTFDNILSNTTIKRAYCVNGNGSGISGVVGDVLPISVRLPGPTISTSANVNEKYGYIDKTVNVPKSMTVPVISTQSDCDDFINVYCTNIHNEYIAAAGDKYDPYEFAAYKPECACFVDPTKVPGVSGIPMLQTSPQCWFSPCSNGAYLPKASRNADGTPKTCPYNIQQCITQSNVTIQGGVAGNAAISSGKTNQVNNCIQEVTNNTTNNETNNTTNVSVQPVVAAGSSAAPNTNTSAAPNTSTAPNTSAAPNTSVAPNTNTNAAPNTATTSTTNPTLLYAAIGGGILLLIIIIIVIIMLAKR